MADKDKSLLDGQMVSNGASMLGESYMDRNLGDLGEKHEEIDPDGNRQLKGSNDGSLVGSGFQEIFNLTTFGNQFTFNSDVYNRGEDERQYATDFIKEQESLGNNVYDEMKKMYHPEAKDMEDTCGFNSASFRSFANGQAPASEANMMTSEQADIAFRHRQEIQQNNGILDVSSLTKAEQATMSSAVVMSQWATNDRSSGVGYLTDKRNLSSSDGYKAAVDYTKNNGITTIKFSDRQMDIMNQHGRDIQRFNDQRTQGARIWERIEAETKAYQKRTHPELNDSDLSDSFDGNKLLRDMVRPAITKKEAYERAETEYMSQNGIVDKALLADSDVEIIKGNAKSILNTENRGVCNDAYALNPVLQGISDLGRQYAKEKGEETSLSSTHRVKNRSGRRYEARRAVIERTQDGGDNFVGQEMVDRRRKISSARRKLETAQSAHDLMRSAVADQRLKNFDKREEKRSDLRESIQGKKDELDKLRSKGVLTDKEKRQLDSLEKGIAKDKQSIKNINKKNHTALLDEKGKGNYREVLERNKKNAEQLAKIHHEHHAALRNRQFADMAGAKGLQSVHAEERILNNKRNDIKESMRDARISTTRKSLTEKAKTNTKEAEKAKKKLDGLNVREEKRKKKKESSSRISSRKGRNSDKDNRFEGYLAGLQNKMHNNRLARFYRKYSPRYRLRQLGRRIRANVAKKLKLDVAKKAIGELLKKLLIALLPLFIILFLVVIIAVVICLICIMVGGSDATKGNPKNEDELAPNYYQATVTALQDYQKSYLDYYSDSAKKAAEGQADSIAQKYSGYLGTGTVTVDKANVRSITNEYGESSSDISDTLQALTMARVRFMGTSLAKDDETTSDTITNMALYMTALWVGDEKNDYIKGLAKNHGGTTGLNHQIVVNPAYNNDSGDSIYSHNSQGGLKDDEGNQYSYIYTNYGELDDSTREACDNIWYKDASGNVQRNPANITWSKNNYGNNGDGTSPSSISVGNPKILNAVVTTEKQNQVEKTETVSAQLKSSAHSVSLSSIQSEDNKNGDHFFRVPMNETSWSGIKSGDIVVIQDGSNYIPVKIGLVAQKKASKNFDAHTNYHYTSANASDVASGKTDSASMSGDAKNIIKADGCGAFSLGSTTNKSLEWTDTWSDEKSIAISGSDLKWDKNSNTFTMADGSPISLPNEAHKRGRVTVTWQDGGRDGGRIIPQMDIFYVQDIQNLIKSDNWKTGDTLPESKSGGIFKKHKKQLEAVFGKGFNPGNDNKSYKLSFPAVDEEDKDPDKDVSYEGGCVFWNKEAYSLDSPWYDQSDRKSWLDANHPEMDEDTKTRKSDVNTFVSMACDIAGDRSKGYKDGTDYWKEFDVKISQGNVNGGFSDAQINKMMAGMSQADISGINSQLGGQIPPGVQSMTAYALGRVGQPYVWGASNESAADCSGFISCIWRHQGYMGSGRYDTRSLAGLGQTWGENDRLPAGSVLVNPGVHTVYVAGWNEATQKYVVIEAMCDKYGIVVSDGTAGRKLRNTSQEALHKEFPIVITKYCTQ